MCVIPSAFGSLGQPRLSKAPRPDQLTQLRLVQVTVLFTRATSGQGHTCLYADGVCDACECAAAQVVVVEVQPLQAQCVLEGIPKSKAASITELHRQRRCITTAQHSTAQHSTAR
jgi:hypothetical protein